MGLHTDIVLRQVRCSFDKRFRYSRLTRIPLVGKVSIDGDMCKGFARSVDFCKHDAIKLVIEDPGFIERTIKRIEPLVDITGR